MIILLYTIIFATFLNECIGQKEGDPIKFACITGESQNEFYIGETNNSIPSTLVDRLNNGKSLSLFFHGVSDSDAVLHGFLYNFAAKWFKASENNICFVSCPYDEMTVKWLEYVAKMASDLLNKIEDPSKIDVSGFGFGAHLAGRTCQHLVKKGKKVKLLLALDPIKTPTGIKIKDTIKSNDANYVQVIHTSREVGMWDQIGDVDIYIKYEADEMYGPLNNEHGIAFFMHIATATKRLYLTAELNENGIGTVARNNQDSQTSVQPNTEPNECAVGVYGSLNPNHREKKFSLSLKNRNLFWGGVGNFAKAEIISGSQERKQKQISINKESKKCAICKKNNKTARLYPCKHQTICSSCWKKWRAEGGPTCPYCRGNVEKMKIGITQSFNLGCLG